MEQNQLQFISVNGSAMPIYFDAPKESTMDVTTKTKERKL